ncbi:MAG TPA: hypothetical protein VGC27_10915 [Rhizomicrobium sp.]
MTTRRTAIAGGIGAALLAALGYRAWDRGAFSSGKGDAYAPWQEWRGHAGEGVRRPLHAAILAANAHNSQPWLFAPSENAITVYADRRRNLGAFDPFRREMHLSLGCAVENLVIAAGALGFSAQIVPEQGELTLSPSPDPVPAAHIVFSPGRYRFRALHDFVPLRHTNRGPYDPQRPISAEALHRLIDFGTGAETRVVCFSDAKARAELAALIVEATQRIIRDEDMSEDSARWFRTGHREILAHRDGVTTDTAGLSPAMAVAAKLLPDQDARSADKYWLAATRDVQAPSAAAFGMVLVMNRLDMAGAIAAGRAWQRMHLVATANGYAAQPLNQPVEMADHDRALGNPDSFGRALREISGVQDWEAAFVFRLGYPERPALPSPRRPLNEVIRQTGLA